MGSARASRALFRALAEKESAPRSFTVKDRSTPSARPAGAPVGTREARVLPKNGVNSYG